MTQSLDIRCIYNYLSFSMGSRKTFKDFMHLVNLLFFLHLVNNVAVSSPIKQAKTGTTEPIHVIVNTSFSCEEVPVEYQRFNFEILTDDDLMSIFTTNGGSFVPNFMATNAEQATNNFKNLLDTTGRIQDWKTRKSKTFDVGAINHITKHDLLSQIRSEPNKFSSDTDKKSRRPRSTDTKDYIGDEQIEYCVLRGDPVAGDPEFLYTCTMCAATRRLPEDYWPRVLSEIVCDSEDAVCFIDNGVPGGKCAERAMYFEILHKRPETCTLALKNEQILIVEVWDIVPETIRVGCECYINVHSSFAQFL